MTALILMYHRVAELSYDHHRLATPPGLFAAQLDTLAARFPLLPLDELRDGAVAITLDDGTYDALDAAAILAGRPATFFVTTARLDEPHEAWWDTLERLFVGPDIPATKRLHIDGADIAIGDDGHQALRDRLLGLGATERDQVMAQLPPLPPRESHRLLVKDELRGLARRPGVSIGAHSVNHLFLTRRPPGEQRRELADSRTTLEAALDLPVTSLAYPFGAHDDGVVAAAADAGFVRAVTTTPRAVASDDHPLRLPRVQAPPLDGNALVAWADALMSA